MRTKRYFASILLCSLSATIVAQGSGPPPPMPPPPPGLPIDSGLVVLSLVAIIYGIYKSLQISNKTL
ncbi:MAG: hypothetical protein HKN99_02300 [Winogradskyella sp.]|nr:hypothetical protein [Winogradskyella sp.]MBT8376101.1 hypothetical protein [Bacteroidia bacterium]NNC44692.1 hypothetical protein [Winogradskyella sp.]NNK39475.1 hypothetical protein [Winogradskyella sp.]NNL82117.1 hypothetical protein [Winogradskyella sp.]